MFDPAGGGDPSESHENAGGDSLVRLSFSAMAEDVVVTVVQNDEHETCNKRGRVVSLFDPGAARVALIGNPANSEIN